MSNPELPEIVLASRSPRRAHLLRQIGIPFRVVVRDVSEVVPESFPPDVHAMTLARRKADAVIPTAPDALIIGADTVVVLEGRLFGKPTSPDDALTMLRTLSGKTHEVITGFVLLWGAKVISESETTKVTFRGLEEWEILDYVATSSPMDKAGAYGIQDRGGLFIESIEGCYYNVVGFPLARFFRALKTLWPESTVRRILGKGSP